MTTEKHVFTQHVLFLKRLFPQYGRICDSALEDLEDLETITDGSVYARIFKAIDDGYQRLPEISKRTGIPQDELKQILPRMLEAGVLTREEQGGKTEEARGARKILFRRAELRIRK